MEGRGHLDSLLVRLSNERVRLSNARSKKEKDLRSVWVSQLEKEVACEQSRLGIEDVKTEMTADELMAELLA